MLRLSDRPRFLICRLSAVGDTIHSLPLAVAIRERWPGAWIVWVAEKGPATLVEQHPAIDRTILAPKGFLKSPSALWKLRRELQRERIEVALDPQSLAKSAICAWFSGARQRIGFAPPQGRELAPWLNCVSLVATERHVVPRYLELLRPLGVSVDREKIRFDLPRVENSAESIEKWLQSQSLAGEPLAVLNPGAGWDSKIWPCERLATVARQLPSRSVVVWAGERERAWAAEIAAQSGGRAQLAPPTSLTELMELVRRAGLFVGSDTGPLHLAAAVGTPCVAIYGPTHPEVCGPWGNGHVVVQSRFEDHGSARKAAGAVCEAMLQVSPDDVLNACKRVLDRSAGQRRAA